MSTAKVIHTPPARLHVHRRKARPLKPKATRGKPVEGTKPLAKPFGKPNK